MNVLILAGGFGRRLGALTTRYPKATLHFAGKSLLAHTLITIPTAGEKIKQIYVTTGYQHTAVERAVKREISSLSLGIPIIMLPPEKQLKGTFKSAVYGLQAADITGGCLIIGIDVVITRSAMSDFLAEVQRTQTTVFMISPLLSIAPTHGLICLKSCGQIAEYHKYSTFSTVARPKHKWYSDVGIRYFSPSFVKKCRSFPASGLRDFDDIMPSLVQKGTNFKAYILREKWLHFGISKDFGQEPLPGMLED